jgi:ATP-dependent DNA helicase RecG
LKDGRQVLTLEVRGNSEDIPFTFEGRAYERVESTTRRMSQEKYERLLLDRAHSRRRWENQGAEGITIRDIDRQEVFRFAKTARTAGRFFDPIGRDPGEALDRLGVRKQGVILRAALVLFGKKFFPSRRPARDRHQRAGPPRLHHRGRRCLARRLR